MPAEINPQGQDPSRDVPHVNGKINHAPGGAELEPSDAYHRVTSIRRDTQSTDEGSHGKKNQEWQTEQKLRSDIATAGRRGERLYVEITSNDGHSHDVYVQGRTFVPASADSDPDAEHSLVQPPRAKGVEVTADKVDEGHQQFGHWRLISSEPGAKIRDATEMANVPDEEVSSRQYGLPLGEIVRIRNGKPYAVVAESVPLTEQELTALAKETNDKLREQRDRCNEPHIAAALPATEKQYKDLAAAQAYKTGYFKSRLVVGTKTAEDSEDFARRIESVLEQPHVNQTFKVEGQPYPSRDAALADSTAPTITGPTEVVTHILPLPRGDEQIPGVEVIEKPRFSTNIIGINRIPEDKRITLGRILDNDDNETTAYVENADEANGHIVVAGATKLGKTAHMTERIVQMVASDDAVIQEGEKQMGVLAITPKEGLDFQDLAHRLPGRNVILIQVGNPDQVNVGIDPTARMPKETPDQAASRVINRTIQAAGAAGGMPEDVVRSIGQYGGEGSGGYTRGNKEVQSLHEEHGFNRKLGTSPYAVEPREPTFAELVDKIVRNAGEHQFTGDASKLPEWLGSWFGGIRRAGEDFVTGEPIDPAKLRESVVILNVNGVQDPVARSIISMSMYDLVTKMMEHEQHNEGDPDRTKYIACIDEASELAKRDTPMGDALGIIAARSRSAGISTIFGVQLLNDLPDLVLANTNTSVILGLKSPKDIDAAASRLGLRDEQKRMIPLLRRGEALYQGPGTGEAVRVALTDPRTLPDGPLPLHSPESLVDAGDRTLYTLREKVQAKELLANRPGDLLQFWTELETISEATAWSSIPPDFAYLERTDVPFFADLQAKLAEDPRVITQAIEQAAKKSVHSREKLFLRDGGDPQVAVDKISKRIQIHLAIYGLQRGYADSAPADLKPYVDSYTIAQNRIAIGRELEAAQKQLEEAGGQNPELLQQTTRIDNQASELDLQLETMSGFQVIDGTLQLPDALRPGQPDDSNSSQRRPVAELQQFVGKINPYSYISASYNVAANRIRTERELEQARNEQASSEPNEELDREITQLEEKARSLAEANQRYSAYKVADGEVQFDASHDVNKVIGNMPTAGNVLIPAGEGGYTIDRILGISIDEACGSESQLTDWKARFKTLVDYFDVPPEQRELYLGEFNGTIDRYIGANPSE